jgi:hypothetical protein
MSTYLYFILNQLGDYVQGTEPYNMNKTLNTHRILRTKDFSLDLLLKACDRLQLGSDFIGDSHLVPVACFLRPSLNQLKKGPDKSRSDHLEEGAS